MPAYVTLFNFTEQGIRNVKESPNRVKAAAEAIKGVGGRFIGAWWLLGQYDGIVILEAPDDETATRFLMATGMQGQRSHHNHARLQRRGDGKAGCRLALSFIAFWPELSLHHL
jgi:uncharacterized protein with GYD domain